MGCVLCFGRICDGGMDAPTLNRNERIRKGIAAYSHEQAILLRLLRKRGSFTEREFDKWFGRREYRRPKLRFLGVTGDTILLGLGQNGFNEWARWLDLMQHMMVLGLIDATTENGVVVYRPMSVTSNH
jgi:hypothetical protein